MPSANERRLRDVLTAFDFEDAFIEVGWDYLDLDPQTVEVGDETFTLHPVAEKRNAVVYRVAPRADGQIPPRSVRRTIDRAAEKSSFERLLVYTDRAESRQIWQYTRRRKDERPQYREHAWYASQDPERLVRRFLDLEVTLDEEDAITLAEVSLRLEDAFDREKITKRFYRDFDAKRTTFLNAIEGITLDDDREWYGSVLLNRLMFVYFLQRKRFLDNNPTYLRDKLVECQQRFGEDEFYSFYRTFLLHLFHDGLGQPESEREAEQRNLLGDVPYLNGGFFQLHEIEERYGDAIDIPDEAFEDLFEFFDAWDWTLDYRPVKEGNEINPDLLGYIFEQYINNKQMGAYYTKEDITGYITRNTLLPFILDTVRRDHPAAFTGPDSVWRLLQDDPDAYIYPAVQQTERTEGGAPAPLPDAIAAGLDDVTARDAWNTRTPPDTEWGLPTEIWRETVSRRQRYLDLRQTLAEGEVTEVHQLVTLNLDIEAFTYDVIQQCESPDLLRAFRNALREVKVLDPTCGSGAFLFAALERLETLYTACLERMQAFIGALDTEEGADAHPERYKDFRKELRAAYDTQQHPNLTYFVLKRILLDNLYGVDIMPEAVEVCKLRLFLKLAAQVEPGGRLEPLPDVDFNVRAGNALVGYATRTDALRGLKVSQEPGKQQELIFEDAEAALDRIATSLDDVARLTEQFRKQQTKHGGRVTKADKDALKAKTATLTDELDTALALEYGVDADDPDAFAAWKASHQPFHWFAEFYDVMDDGGFDVIIGNPPYVQLRKIKDYELRGYDTLDGGDLYPLVMERCMNTGDAEGWQGFIVPVSSVSTDGYSSLQDLIRQRSVIFSAYDDRPSKLFNLQHSRLAIHLIVPTQVQNSTLSTRYNKWMSDERDVLFEALTYADTGSDAISNSLPKLSHPIEDRILDKLQSDGATLGTFENRKRKHVIYYSRKVGYFLQALNFVPIVLNGNGERREPSEFKRLRFSEKNIATIALACLNSNLMYWFVHVFSDCRHLNKREVAGFPVDLERLAGGASEQALLDATKRLMQDLKDNSVNRTWRDLTIQNIIPRHSKPIIDEIDTVLADHYGFTDEELDFIVNYDVKYRLGVDAFPVFDSETATA